MTLRVRNMDLNETTEIKSNKIVNLLDLHPTWSHTHNIVVIIGELKFKCDSEEKLELYS